MAINPIVFYDQLASHGVDFFTGVPDSLLKEFCLCVDDRVSNNKHVIAANEGSAIALAAGYYLAQQSLPLVYMQNSGLGNAVNPLLSLCDPDVYSIPVVIMIGWRGEPGVKDEPQHIKQGKIQIELLETMNIPYEIISGDDDKFKIKISSIVDIAKNNSKAAVLLIKKGTFERYSNEIQKSDDRGMKRETSLQVILENLDSNVIVVSTTGKTSREIFEIRENKGHSHQQDFLTVGSMGHCSSIALGIAIAKPDRKIVCIDGDGAMIMHMGILTTIAILKPKNFHHILLNNEVHDSVGGQDTAAKNVDLSKVVAAIGSSKIFKVENPLELKNSLREFMACDGPSFLEVKIQPGSRSDLGRPNVKPIENKESFMAFLDR